MCDDALKEGERVLVATEPAQGKRKLGAAVHDWPDAVHLLAELVGVPRIFFGCLVGPAPVVVEAHPLLRRGKLVAAGTGSPDAERFAPVVSRRIEIAVHVPGTEKEGECAGAKIFIAELLGERARELAEAMCATALARRR